MNLQDLAQQREAIRDRKRELAAEEKQLNEQLAALDQQLFEYLDEQGVDRLSTNGITLSISESVVPHVTDWESVYAFVRESGNFQLFERRASSVAYRELLALRDGEMIPGVEPFTKRTINMRVTR